ncbi:hypothetical protein MMC13_001743 [Lambiella insularis]|nr:hypothetical protein [Lambiella insularis]
MTGFKAPPYFHPRNTRDKRSILHPISQPVKIEAAPNDFNNCLCDLLDIPGGNIQEADAELCVKHGLMGKAREKPVAPVRPTVIVDLEEHSSEEERIPSQSERKLLELERQRNVVKRLEKKDKKWKADLPPDFHDFRPLPKETGWTITEEIKFTLHQARLRRARDKLAVYEKKENVNGDKKIGDSEKLGKARRDEIVKAPKMVDTATQKERKRLLAEQRAKNFEKSVREYREMREFQRRESATKGLFIPALEYAQSMAPPKAAGNVAALSTRGSYDRRTLASDVLRAAGIHPYSQSLNMR